MDKDNCPGPCELHAWEKGFARFDSPMHPARVYRRGEKVRISYQRNNHGPGGFTRLSLVPWNQMMNKEVHKRNAFHYSCWGAHPVKLPKTRIGKDDMRFSFDGTDGDDHHFPISHYVTYATIPDCIPDGCYIFGWVWFGGTGSSITTANGIQEPTPYGIFGDYYSCSSVRIQGGRPLKKKCDKKFVNDMARYSKSGCMSTADDVGVCAREPCRKTGKYQKPREFANNNPPALYSHYYSGAGYNAKATCSQGDDVGMSSCHCVDLGYWCGVDLAKRTKGNCKARTKFIRQPMECRVSCCKFCRKNRNHAYCRGALVRSFLQRMGPKC